MRRSLLVTTLIFLVILDVCALFLGVVLFTSAALVESRVSLPGLAVVAVGLGLLWLTVHVARLALSRS
jgi:hypothetical protein